MQQILVSALTSEKGLEAVEVSFSQLSKDLTLTSTGRVLVQVKVKCCEDVDIAVSLCFMRLLQWTQLF